MKEKAMYKPVAAFLEESYGCDPKLTWTAGCGRDLAFAAGFGKRKPDVVAVCRKSGAYEVHLVEGKLPRVATHGFEDTRNQLDSFRQYADRLWAAFPEAQWRDAANNHERWKRQLRERGYGLLLVNGAAVTVALPAEENQEIEQEEKGKLVQRVLAAMDAPVFVPPLEPGQAALAARCVARVVELMTDPIRKRLKERAGGRSDVVWHFDSAYNEAIVGNLQGDSLWVQGDPFGYVLKDARPVVWVWCEFGDLEEGETKILAATAGPHPEGTYYYAEKVDYPYECECRPVAELDISRLRSAGFLSGFCLGRVIQVDGQSKSTVERALDSLVAWHDETAKALTTGGAAQPNAST
jgi:hypothetical protein